MEISNNISNEIIIKKSKFITYLYKISSKEELEELLNNVKSTYKDATHICYAYILNGNEKSFDDNEPSGTAGNPMLSILQKKNLNKILAITIRYFGGIKLGASGLIRAYAFSVNNALKLTNIIKQNNLIKVTLSSSYDDQKLLNNITSTYQIDNKSFDKEIIYQLLLNANELDNLKEAINKTNIKMLIN